MWGRRRRKALRLKEHAGRVAETVEELGRQVRAWVRREVVQPDRVSERERAADEVKREIRGDWAREARAPLPTDRLLELLWHQDEIADLAQDAALLLALRRPELGLELGEAFRALSALLDKVVHSYTQAIGIFEEAWATGAPRGKEAEVVSHVDFVHRLEHESDLLEREIVATVYKREDMPAFDRYHVVQVALVLGNLVDQVENAAGDLALILAAAR